MEFFVWFRIIICALCAMFFSYLLGSISFAIIITKGFIKKDIRDFGSGNAGMTNVLRTVGKFPAVLTLIGDMGKAVLAIYLSRYFFSGLTFPNAAQVGMYIGGLFVLLGHIYPVFYNFRGGKGVLTCAGIFCVLDWQLCLLAILIFIAVAFISGYVSLGSICAMASAPISTLVFGLTIRADTLATSAVLWQTFFVFFIASISILLHKENIKRLLNHTENGFKKYQKERAAKRRAEEEAQQNSEN